MINNQDIECVEQVIKHLNLTPASYLSAQQAKEIQGYILDTLELISPFRPSREAMEKLNSYLYLHKATQMQCIVAWTMFMDIRSLANLHEIPRKSFHVA